MSFHIGAPISRVQSAMILVRFAISMFALTLLGVAISYSSAHSAPDAPGVTVADESPR
jgi:hypothetical protein